MDFWKLIVERIARPKQIRMGVRHTMPCPSGTVHPVGWLPRYLVGGLVHLILGAILAFGPSAPAAEAEVWVAPRPARLQAQLSAELQTRGSDYQPRTEHRLSDGTPRFTNRLILEASPYLIQHAHNPVDWYPWGAEAFARAAAEDRPIFLSIGYSSCHWCHVMEREVFEDLRIADFLNRHFIAIKVDKERRPDLDETYMPAVRLIKGRGGWPMSSFLTPEGRPFFAGTFFWPDDFLGQIQRLATQWQDRRQDLVDEAQRIAAALSVERTLERRSGEIGPLLVEAALAEAAAEHDPVHGGFVGRSKFPREPLLLLLLDSAQRRNDERLLRIVTRTLDAMRQGGIHDQVGGGFHRYATDAVWRRPHFEKMLYNQALLARVYLRGWRLTGHAAYRRVAERTLDYVLRDLTAQEGAFYTAIDADSDGREGAFYTWTAAQIRQALPAADAALAIDLFGVTEAGALDGTNVLHLAHPPALALAEIAHRQGVSLAALQRRLADIRQVLYRAREQRPHPQRDEKILTAWNGLMIGTLALAGDLLGEARFTRAALDAARFLWAHCRREDGKLWRVHYSGRASVRGQLEDYALLAEGLLRLYDTTNDRNWLLRAQQLADTLHEHFQDKATGRLFLSERAPLNAMPRPQDTMTGDIRMPAPVSVTLRVWQMLSIRSDRHDYAARAHELFDAYAADVRRSPAAYAYLLAAVDDLQHGEQRALGYAARGHVRIAARQEADDRVGVSLSMLPGWHVNADQPLQQGLIPTRLELATESSGWRLTQVEYPEAGVRPLGFHAEPLALYQGEARIVAHLQPADRPRRLLPLSLRLQACNDRVCLPPESLRLTVPMATAMTSKPPRVIP
jgi:uncharacterized protein YyaL (SSP411 family)